jgi:serine/threonine protein kinase
VTDPDSLPPGGPTLAQMLATPAVLTPLGTLLGTPAYMAPEQLRGGRADSRSDLFSFCTALYEAVAGTRP